VLEALTLKDLTLKDCSLLLLLILEDLLATAFLAPVLIRYIASFAVRVAIIVIRALRLRNIVMRGKAMNMVIIIGRFKRKKVRVI